MKVQSWYELVAEAGLKGETYVTRDTKLREYIRIVKEYSLDLGICHAINYDAKTDRYVGKFGGTGRDATTIKLTMEVAKYLLEHRNYRDPESGNISALSVFMKMDESGAGIDCLLLYN